KASAGLNKVRLVNISKIAEMVGKPENLAIAQQIADDAVTLVRHNELLPLKKSGTTVAGVSYQYMGVVSKRLTVVIFSQDIRTTAGREFERQIRARVPTAHIMYVDEKIAAALSPDVLNAVDRADAVIAAVDVAPVAAGKEDREK